MNILKNAIDLHQKNKFEQAKNLYEKILEQEPKNFEATQDRKSTRLNSSHRT